MKVGEGQPGRPGAGRPVPDITPLPDLVHGAPRAGPVRARRPVYLDLLPPCNAGCPAGENIQPVPKVPVIQVT